MKKKFFAILTVLAMLISLVPMSGAFAAEEHECGFDTMVSISDTQHQFKCDVCGEFVGVPMNHSDSDGDGFCNCGYNLYPKHECSFDTLVSISDTQHQFKCSCGEFVGVPMNHDDSDGDGKCNCGYEMYKAPEEEHEHNYVAHSNGDGTHELSCTCGGSVAAMACTDNDGDKACDSCGYVMYSAPETHEHNYVAHNNGDGTHELSCTCGLRVEAVACLDSDGDDYCDSCSALIYSDPVDDHEHNYVAHSNNDGTHELSCNCGKRIDTACYDADGDDYCDACGYLLYSDPVGDHEHNYVAHSNNDGTHELSCNCGYRVDKITCLDADGDDYCDSCGYLLYSDPVGEHTHNYIAHSLDNGTHDVSCNCGLAYVEDCYDEDEDGLCDACGDFFFAEPEEDDDLDDVPQTGSKFLDWLLGLFFLIFG